MQQKHGQVGRRIFCRPRDLDRTLTRQEEYFEIKLRTSDQLEETPAFKSGLLWETRDGGGSGAVRSRSRWPRSFIFRTARLEFPKVPPSLERREEYGNGRQFQSLVKRLSAIVVFYFHFFTNQGPKFWHFKNNWGFDPMNRKIWQHLWDMLNCKVQDVPLSISILATCFPFLLFLKRHPM